MDRIAFVNAAGALFTVDPEGRAIRALTGDVQAAADNSGAVLAQPLDRDEYYTWPTWSPDGSKIAASRVEISAGETKLSIIIIDTKTDRIAKSFENEVNSLVARGLPHYMYWSPDSRYLAFIASTEPGLALFVKDTDSAAAPALLITGAPIYFNWAPDGSALLLHQGNDIKLAEAPFDVPARLLLTSPAFFRVPALSPDGSRFAYIRDDGREAGSGGSLVVAPTDNPESGVMLLDVEDTSALAWSPDGTELAVIDQLNQESTVYQRLRVAAAGGGEVRTITEGNILAFFWFPTGEEIAWVDVDFDEGEFIWMTSPVHAGSGEQDRTLLRFQPSTDVFTMFSFFDQFAYSNSPWSPDGARLVFAGTMETSSGQKNGQTPRGNRIFVLDAAGVKPPLDIAGGSLAFWSWN